MSDNEDLEKEIRLRDQIATAAMQSLIVNQKLYGSLINDNDESPKSATKAERLAIAAYKIADAMRKARLASFK